MSEGNIIHGMDAYGLYVEAISPDGKEAIKIGLADEGKSVDILILDEDGEQIEGRNISTSVARVLFRRALLNIDELGLCEPPLEVDGFSSR